MKNAEGFVNALAIYVDIQVCIALWKHKAVHHGGSMTSSLDALKAELAVARERLLRTLDES